MTSLFIIKVQVEDVRYTGWISISGLVDTLD